MEGMEIEYLAKEIKISQEEMRKVLGQVYSLPARVHSPGHLFKSYNKEAASYVPKGETVNTGDLLTAKQKTEEKYEYLLCRWYHRFARFFKIGFGYDWEEQYKEYKEFWENYFYGKQAGKGGLKTERMAV